MATILAESGVQIIDRVTDRAQGQQLLAAILAKFSVRGVLEGTAGTIHSSFTLYLFCRWPVQFAGLLSLDVLGL